MSTNWDAVHTECPFYISESNKSITCEGLINNKSTVHLFERREDKKKHKCIYCNNTNAFKYCEHYYSLMKTKYCEE